MLRNVDEFPPILRSLLKGRLLMDWMVWALSEQAHSSVPTAWSPAPEEEELWLLSASSFGDLVTSSPNPLSSYGTLENRFFCFPLKQKW